MFKAIKHIYGWGVRICAMATFGVGIYVIAYLLIPSFKTPMADFIVAGKFIGPGAYCFEFYEPDHPQNKMQYYFNGHHGFYEAAWPGDHMRVASERGNNIWGSGYRQLVRDGRVVARSFSDDQEHGTLFVIAALLPILVFLPVKNRIASQVIWGVAVTGEAIVIGVLMFVALMFYAIGHATNC